MELNSWPFEGLYKELITYDTNTPIKIVTVIPDLTYPENYLAPNILSLPGKISRQN